MTPHARHMVLPTGQPGEGQLVQCSQVQKASVFQDTEQNPFAHSGGGGLIVNFANKLNARTYAESFLCNTGDTSCGMDITKDNGLQTSSPVPAS